MKKYTNVLKILFLIAVLIIFLTSSTLSLKVKNTQIEYRLDDFDNKISTLNLDYTIVIPDDYPTIKEGIENSESGDIIFVRSGIYYENIVVNKTGLTLIGENKFNTIINGGKTKHDAMIIESSDVKITGFTFTNAINEPSLWNISGLRIKSSRAVVTGNRFVSNRLGISVMANSKNLVISNNSFINDGIFLGNYLNSKSLSKQDFLHTIKNNTVNGKPLYYYKNTKDFIVPDDAGQVILANCVNVTVKDLYLTNTDFSIILGFCKNCTIKNTTVLDTDGEVILCKSYNNVIQNNKLINNLHGVCIDYKSDNNTVENNYVSENMIGISALTSSSNNQISNNIVTDNQVGIYLSMFCFPGQHDNIISKNIVDNNKIGINLKDNSYNNIVEKNTLSNSTIGIQLSNSSNGNLIKSNVFKNNFLSALFIDCDKSNVWSNNYWGRPRLFSKIIFGINHFGRIPYPIISFDKNPLR